jgi:DNA processing protein
MGIAIISGLALGIDAIAHRAVVDSGGRGIAVLASGLDKITPSSNIFLAKNLLEKGGCIVSEFPLGHEPTKIDFPSRNRIISGMSKIVLVIEGAKKSGTLLTASHAGNQGRTVFAVPGQITSPNSEVPHFLIQNGARIAFSPKDILDELGVEFKVDRGAVEKIMPGDEIEKKILEILEKEPLHLDEVSRISKLEVSLISSKLTILVLKGLIKEVEGNVYKIV